MSTLAEPLLTAEGLVKHFTRRGDWYSPMSGRILIRAVDGIDLHVAQGETLAVVGESGSGKTTVARCLLRLLQPDAGEIRLGGVDFLALRGRALRKQRQRIQMLFQDSFGSLDPRMDIADLVTEPLSVGQSLNLKNTVDEASRLLRKVGLGADLLKRRRTELSAGQRQRVAIARALALSPDIVVLDEPVSHLDPPTKAQILAVLRDLQRSGCVSFILITHDLTVASELAHRIAVMFRGRIVETGRTPDLFGEPLHPYTRQLLESKRWFEAPTATSLSFVGQRLPVATSIEDKGGCGFRERCPMAIADCAHVDPELVEVSSGRAAACIRVAGTQRMKTP